jgi:hypothetical protein
MVFVGSFSLVPGGTFLRLYAGPAFPVLQDIEFLEPSGVTVSGGSIGVTIDQYTSSPPFYLRTTAAVLPGIFAAGRLTYPLQPAVHLELYLSPTRTVQMRLG